MAKAPTKRAAPKADGQNIMNSSAAEADTASTVESGMEQGPTAREKREEVNRTFAKADAKGQAAIIEETQVGLQVRGY